MWWESLTNLQQVSFIIATTATAIMIIFIILMLIGMDGAESFDGDVDLDVDVDMDIDADIDIDEVDGSIDIYNNDSILSISGLRIVTIRGALAFFSTGGWPLDLFAESMPVWLAVILSILTGAVASILLAYAMRAAMKLESSGNLHYQTAVGKTAVVYIRIPKELTGKGKVLFNHQGKMVEVDAVTKGKEDIISKREVKIVGLQDETTLVVKKIEEEK